MDRRTLITSTLGHPTRGERGRRPAHLGDEYQVNDADGSRPHFVRWLRENEPKVAEAWKKLDDTFYSYWGTMPYELPGS